MKFRGILTTFASFMTLFCVSAVAQVTVNLAYDGDGNLVAKTVNGITTQYLVDDMNPTGLPQVMEETVNGVVQRRYTYGKQRISEIQLINGAWVTSYYGYDAQGNVRQLTNSAGVVTDTYDYDAFGNLVNHTGTTPNVYLYRGERYDPDMGMYYMRARWYNPATGRFMSRDPENGDLTNPKTLHKYLYAHGDPVNLKDPSGRAAVGVALPISQIDIPTIAAVTAVGVAAACVFYTIGETLGIAAAGGTPIPQPLTCSARSKKWKCTAYCHVVNYGTGNTTIGPSAEGFGNSETNACQAAQDAAKAWTPRGSYPRHCRCDECTQQ